MIGVFDSGIGGLTVLAALRRAMPQQDLLYLGDTARVPYGTRSGDTVIRYSLRVGSYLVDQGIHTLVIACNTATTFALPALQEACAPHNVRVFGVIEPGVDAALACHKNGTLAVLGTEGTIAGGAYEAALRERSPGLDVVTRACPLFVPLVEEGWLEGEVPRATAEAYLADLRGRVQTAILGCTHYPLLRATLQDALPNVTLIDSATATAAAVKQALEHSGVPGGSGTTDFRVTDHLSRFQRVGERFLGTQPNPVTWIDLSEATGSFAMSSAD